MANTGRSSALRKVIFKIVVSSYKVSVFVTSVIVKETVFIKPAISRIPLFTQITKQLTIVCDQWITEKSQWVKIGDMIVFMSLQQD